MSELATPINSLPVDAVKVDAAAVGARLAEVGVTDQVQLDAVASAITATGGADKLAALAIGAQLAAAHDEMRAFYAYRLNVLEQAQAAVRANAPVVLESLADSLAEFGAANGVA